MKTCKMSAGFFADIVIEGIRFAIVEPELILFNASDKLDCVEIDSWFMDQLLIMAKDPDMTAALNLPARMLDSPIVDGGKIWLNTIIEAACEIAVTRGTWHYDDESERKADEAYDMHVEKELYMDFDYSKESNASAKGGMQHEGN
jgi:hypothetical protein